MDSRNVTMSDVNQRKEDNYSEFEKSITTQFTHFVGLNTPIFITDAPNLWDLYLNNLPEEGRQHYNCNCCRHFINKYGNLVALADDLTLIPVMWSVNVPSYFKKSVDAMISAVEKARITDIFISDEIVLGTPKTGLWTHLSAELPAARVNKSRIKTAYQIMCEKHEEYKMLIRAVQEYSLDTINKAIGLLETDTLYRGERVLGVANWFKRLIESRNSVTSSRLRENMMWFSVANAPEGFCHVKSSMIGTLLDDIASGMSFDKVTSRFKEKMSPSSYRRSQTAPTQGGIAQAEKLIENLGIANSLRRRYATFNEIPEFIWINKGDYRKEAPKTGVFSGLTPKVRAEQPATTDNGNLPTTVMTWDKFQKTVLPTASNVEVKVDNNDRLMALVTAADSDAENILLWDNTFSWYYHAGVDAEIKKRVENAGGKYSDNIIRCSLIWEGYTDLDLHCITPNGEEIYYRNKKGRCGGWLDVDANGLDGRTPTPVENMRWSIKPRTGRYRFYVHNFAERTNFVKGTPFEVELEIEGKIYRYKGEPLMNDRSVTVFNFNYIPGQQPNIDQRSVPAKESWNTDGKFIKVNGITTSPNTWGENHKPYAGGHHVFFILDGVKDESEGKGRGFFTEMLKPELMEIRKTLEAYTAATPIEGVEDASACGIGFSKDNPWDVVLKVTTDNSTRLIKIDRFD